MKGQSEFMEVIIDILMFVGLFAILIIVAPTLVGEMAKQLALEGADAVSREIAGLISMSAASTDEMNINWFTLSKKTSYNIEIDSKKVDVEMLDENKKPLQSASSKILIDPSNEFSAIQSLTIRKSRPLSGNIFGIQIEVV